MHIFVAGATGVLGRRVVPRMVAQGHGVTAVARTPQKAEALRRQGAVPVSVDLFDPRAVTKAVEGHDVVVNLATAIPATSTMLRRSAWWTNDRLRTEAAGHLVEAARAVGAARVVQESIAFAYPDRGAAWIDEDVPLDLPPFAAAVQAAEAHTRRFGDGGGTGVVLRLGLLMAADSHHTSVLVHLLRYRVLALPEPAAGYRPWVHADDTASAVVAALDAPAGVYNVVEDQPLTGREHAAVLEALTGRRLVRPPEALAVGAYLRAARRSQRVSNRRLRDTTGWRPRSDRHAAWAEILQQPGPGAGAVTSGAAR